MLIYNFFKFDLKFNICNENRKTSFFFFLILLKHVYLQTFPLKFNSRKENHKYGLIFFSKIIKKKIKI